MLVSELCNVVSNISSWLEGNVIIFNHLPKAHLGQQLKRTLATFCCSLAFMSTVNFQHFWKFRMHPSRNHISFLGGFCFCSAAWWIEGHRHSEVAFILETCIDFSQFSEPFDDILSHWWWKTNLHTNKLHCLFLKFSLKWWIASVPACDRANWYLLHTQLWCHHFLPNFISTFFFNLSICPVPTWKQ